MKVIILLKRKNLKMDIENIHILLKVLKHASLKDHLHFVSFIINNSEKLKFLDNFTIYDYSLKSILNKTLLQVFEIKNWTSLVETAIMNDKIYNIFIKKDEIIPSHEVLIATCEVFTLVYHEPLNNTILHFLSTTNDNYLLYCMTEWLKLTNNHMMDLAININQTNLEIFNKFMQPNEHLLIEQTFKHNSMWRITSPIYYKETKTIAIGICYDGMGWYNTLSISFLPQNKNKPYFFTMNGGSSMIDYEFNDKFFRTKQPPNNKLFDINMVLEHITNNTFKDHLFSS
jgi:hypothetical protein